MLCGKEPNMVRSPLRLFSY